MTTKRHILDTQTFNCFRRPISLDCNFIFFNIIEDWRVETLLGKHFPGCRKNFDFIIVYLFGKERQKAGSNAPAFFVLEYILFDYKELE